MCRQDWRDGKWKLIGGDKSLYSKLPSYSPPENKSEKVIKLHTGSTYRQAGINTVGDTSSPLNNGALSTGDSREWNCDGNAALTIVYIGLYTEGQRYKKIV